MKRTFISYGYLCVLAALIVLMDLSSLQYDWKHPDSIVTVAFLIVAAAFLKIPQVRIEQGRLTLSGIAFGVAALLLNPLDATLVGVGSSVVLFPRGRYPLVANAVLSAAIGSTGAIVATTLRNGSDLSTTARLAVLATCVAVNLLLVPTLVWVRGDAPIIKVMQFNFSPSFVLAFVYFGLAALLISYVLDGTALGYLLTAVVCVLALALTDTIAGRRVRRVLESELSDADRHLFHSRAVEGVVHNLRNHLATTVGYLKEIDPRRLDPIDRESIETASAAANDAVAVLKGLSQGATPRVTYSVEPVDLNELVTRALGMARPRARSKEVQLAVRESPEDVKVKADPLLMREVVTNLVNNAIDASPHGGKVELSAGRRPNGWAFLSVADNGPGISDENRHRLFEPHFTTKEGGTGLGLFMSYGVVREHRGDLVYEGNRRGAVFTVLLPKYSG